MKENANWMEKFMAMDRRWIFILVAISVTVPLVAGTTIPVNTTPAVEAIYEYVDALPEGSVILLAADYDPASEAELYPMMLAIMRHSFDKGHKILSFTLWPNGAALIDRAFNELELEYDITRGEDFINFGYAVGGALVIVQAGQNMQETFPNDYRGQSTTSLELMQGINNYDDIDYVIDLAAGSTIGWWIGYGKERYGFDFGAGCTAVSATEYYPYLDTGQLNGLIGGLKGAAEYELLSGHPAKAMAGMTAQSSVHALIVILVVVSNIFYFITRKKG